MKLSVLDQAPISTGMSEQEALQAMIDLAKHAEKHGYERFWVAEHHDLFGLASPNPSVMISAIGAQTEQIRLGAGAVLLPYYKPFSVAETYNLLATLYPNRIDLGLGRAPGGSAEVSQALSDNYLAGVREFPAKIAELQSFFKQDFPEDHPFSKITPTPVPPTPPDVWLLGTSEKSAKLAAEKGMKYAFGHFMTDVNGPEIVTNYRKEIKRKHPGKQVEVIIAISVICADTTEEAERLALSQWLWKKRQNDPKSDGRVPSVKEAENYPMTKEDEKDFTQMKEQMIIGDPNKVRDQLTKLDFEYEADEYMVITIVHDPIAKRHSYTLLQEVNKNIARNSR